MKTNKLILLFLCLYILSCREDEILKEPSQISNRIIAHRGFSGIAPENTLIAFQKAIDFGADYIELDVRKTKEDSIVVIHDSSVDRTSSDGIKGEVRDMTFQDLRKINVGYPARFGNEFITERISTLREVLTLAKGKIKVCIEIKESDMEMDVLKIVYDLKMNDDVVIACFNYSVISKIRALDKNIPTLFLINSLYKSTIDSTYAIESKTIGTGSFLTLTKENIEIAHEYEMEIWAYTINNKEDIEQLIGIGVDGIITDFPNIAWRIN